MTAPPYAATIRTVAETGSTNADLLAAADGASEGSWLRAERQTGGRGRMGRAWLSPAGNLHASTVIRLRAGDPPPPSLALVAGIALHTAACGWAGAGAAGLRLKWPNDLLYEGAKLAGILLERAGDAVVAGFGVNLAERPAVPDRQVATLAEAGDMTIDPALFLEDLAGSFARGLQAWRAGGIAPVIAAWQAAAHPIGTALAAGAGTRRIEGLFAGLDAAGNLLLRMPDSRIETINAGDVILLE